MKPASCPEEELFETLVSGSADAATRKLLESHVSGCARCAAELASVRQNVEEEERIRGVLRGLGPSGAALIASAAAPAMLLRIGPFRILRELGRGGMGIVYLAEQDHPHRRVALKVVRPGFASGSAGQRFRQEANALAHLRHPGIAQIYEAGVADVVGPGGVVVRMSYFAMELVEGERVDAYVEHQRLDPEQRIELLARICDAVEHAHQRGIVHRDLKPDNILIVPTGEDPIGQPKILDFGVARMTDAEAVALSAGTATGQLIGTLPFMSPEQVEGGKAPVDARSDVYALGVLGHLLFAGRLPYDLAGLSVVEACRTIREQEPVALSPGMRHAGDLGTILGKALEKDPMGRYTSAAELSLDLRRLLRSEPILARPPSTLYQLRKFARRNRALVTGFAAGVVALAVFGIAMSVLYTRAQRAEDHAREEARTAERVAGFMVEIFGSADPSVSPGRELTAREILDRGAARMRKELASEPHVLASLLVAIGDVNLRLGRYEEARAEYDEALALRRRLYGENALVAEAVARTASARNYLGDREAAEESAREALGMARRTAGGSSPVYGEALEELAAVLRDLGRYEEAVGFARESVDLHRRLHGDLHLKTAGAWLGLATIYRQLGRHDSAEVAHRRVVEVRRALLGDSHADLAGALTTQGDNLTAWGRYPEAEPVCREALAILERVHAEPHDDVAVAAYNLARVLLQQGKRDEAEPLYRRAIEIRERVHGTEHPDLAPMLSGLGGLLEEEGEQEEALALYRRGLALAERHYGVGHLHTAAYLNNIGLLLVESGRPGEGESYILWTLELMSQAVGEKHVNTARVINNLARAKTALGQHERARELYDRAYDLCVELLGEDHAETAKSLHYRANDLRIQDRWVEAEADAQRACRIRRVRLGPEHKLTAESESLLGEVLLRLGRTAEADTLLVRSYEKLRSALPATDRRVREAQRRLAELERARELSHAIGGRAARPAAHGTAAWRGARIVVNSLVPAADDRID